MQALLPFLRAKHPPPNALLNGSLLLANALRLRSNKGTLEQRLEAERIREREEAEGTRAANEAERARLLEAALPVLLRIARLRDSAAADFNADALAASLDALCKLSTNPHAAEALLRHGALDAACELTKEWPSAAGLPPLVSLNVSEMIRLLLLAAARKDDVKEEAEPSTHEEADAEEASDEASRSADDAGTAALLPPPSGPVASQAGEYLPSVLAWALATSDAFPVPDAFTEEEKLQRGLCALLCTLLSAPPVDATLGHPELEALRPLLQLLKTQRTDAELSAEGCRALSVLSARSITLCKQVAKLQGIKTLLLTMRQHIKREDVNEHSASVLRSMCEASDGCRKLVVDAHGVPMLCAVMKRHSLAPKLQRDAIAALAALTALPAGLKAVAREKEGVEVLVAGMLLCAREKLDFEAAKGALQTLVDAEPNLLKRITMANGKKWLRGATSTDVDVEVESVTTEPKDEQVAEAQAEPEAATGA